MKKRYYLRHKKRGLEFKLRISRLGDENKVDLIENMIMNLLRQVQATDFDQLI